MLHEISSGPGKSDHAGDAAAAAAAAGGLLAMLGVAGGIAICCAICFLMPGFNRKNFRWVYLAIDHELYRQ
jgi:hypothetical protein